MISENDLSICHIEFLINTIDYAKGILLNGRDPKDIDKNEIICFNSSYANFNITFEEAEKRRSELLDLKEKKEAELVYKDKRKRRDTYEILKKEFEND